MNLSTKLLCKNISKSRIVVFLLSNFLGLAIVMGGLQFYLDAKGIWEEDDSFIRTDYLVVNKRVTSENTMGASSAFSAEELEDLRRQPWVGGVAPFVTADYHVNASMQNTGRSMSTAMFFESIPDEYIDVPSAQWRWREGEDVVPLIISKDYLTLYNFGFAASAGLPKMSEGLMSGIPLTLTLRSEDGMRTMQFHGRVVGYSNRLNTILVPSEFMDWSNKALGTASGPRDASRLMVRTTSPGDVAIGEYIDAHDWEIAGDKRAAAASFMLKVVVGIVTGIGVVITLLSFFILLLSISLLMEKNKGKMHSLLMLGYEMRAVGKPFRAIVIFASAGAWVLACGALLVMRSVYIDALTGLGAEPAGLWIVPALGLGLTLLVIGFNIMAVNRKTLAAYYKVA